MRRTARARAAAAAGVAALLLGQEAAACSVCTGGSTPESQYAFFWASLAISILPLAMLGGILLWIHRRMRMAERAESAARDRAEPAPPAARPGVTLARDSLG